MSAVLAVQPSATLDEFLADPLVLSELAAVLDALDEGKYRLRIKGTYPDYWMQKRERVDSDDAARLILAAWREHRP